MKKLNRPWGLVLIGVGVVCLISLFTGLFFFRNNVASAWVTKSQPTPTLVVPAQGATLPYVEYQAEDAATNGVVIGPDRSFMTLASEASARKAVRLTAQQYVEFTLQRSANSIVVRYSIPDSPDGVGLTAPLSLYINGARQHDLSLTSKYSWIYGYFPFSNRPREGKAHRFYDETRLLLPEMAAGTKVRLQVDPEDTAASYVIDLADFEEVAPPATQPDGYLSLKDFGADPTGAADATQALSDAMVAAKSQGKSVWIPQGTFSIPGHVIVDNVTIRGAGPWYSVLHGTGVGLFGNSSPTPSKNVKLYDFAIYGEVMERNDKLPLNAIGGAMGGGSVIQNIWIEHTKVGMWFDGPFSDLLITGCRIRDTTADGLNLHQGISNVTVQQTEVRNTGDDGLAMWAEKEANHNNVFKYNTVELPMLANNIAIYGGADNTVSYNYVTDTLWQGGGIHVGNRFGAALLSGTTTIDHNLLVRTGELDVNWKYGVGAIWFYALDAEMLGNINVSNDEIDDSTYEAIQFTGSSVSNVTFDHVNIDKAGTFAIQEQATGSATFNYVTATNLGVTGQYNCGKKFTITKGAGNSGWDDTQCTLLTVHPTPTITATQTTP